MTAPRGPGGRGQPGPGPTPALAPPRLAPPRLAPPPAPPRARGRASGHVTAAQVSTASGSGLGESRPAPASTRWGARETMASSSVPPAAAPAAAGGPGPGFGFASKTKKKHFVQQKVKVFRAADPLVGVFLWGVAHSVRTGRTPSSCPSIGGEGAPPRALRPELLALPPRPLPRPGSPRTLPRAAPSSGCLLVVDSCLSLCPSLLP